MGQLLTRTKFRLRVTAWAVIALWFLQWVFQASFQPAIAYAINVAAGVLFFGVAFHAFITRLVHLPSRWPPRSASRPKWLG